MTTAGTDMHSATGEAERAQAPSGARDSLGRQDLVVCLHGLGRTRHCWWFLRRRLERAGFATVAWTYPSFGHPIERLGQDCLDRLATWAADPTARRIHLLTHSLGGIVSRSALGSADQVLLARLGWVVMLAPPNRGSAWARRLGPLLGWAVPSLPQLSDAAESYVNRLPAPPASVRLAIIAAASDGKCPLSTTHLPGEAAHIVVPGRHTFIMYRRDVADAILGLLGSNP